MFYHCANGQQLSTAAMITVYRWAQIKQKHTMPLTLRVSLRMSLRRGSLASNSTA